MLNASQQYKQAIHAPHRRRTIVDVEDAAGNLLIHDLPLSGGTVSASLTSRVTRSAVIDVASDGDRLAELGGLWPDDITDPTSPAVGLLRIWSGIQYADGSTELFPLFRGRIQDAVLGSDGGVSLRADDLAADVVANRFEVPRNSSRGSVLTEIQTLVSEALPGAVFGVHDAADATCPELTWDEDRGQALDDLAEALGARWLTLGDGSFVVRAFPYDNGTTAQTLEDGLQGLLQQATVTRTRAGTANSVTVVSERVDGTDPVRVTARNTVSGSPTRYGDAYGRVSQVIKIQTPLTNNEATRLARAQLNAATALTEQWTATCTADHSLEPGDAVLLRSRGRTAVQVIDSISYPLVAGDDMSVQTRAFTVPPVSLGS